MGRHAYLHSHNTHTHCASHIWACTHTYSHILLTHVHLHAHTLTSICSNLLLTSCSVMRLTRSCTLASPVPSWLNSSIPGGRKLVRSARVDFLSRPRNVLNFSNCKEKRRSFILRVRCTYHISPNCSTPSFWNLKTSFVSNM